MKTELNFDKTIVPGEVVPRVMICPDGNWPGEKTIQVCDRIAFEQLIADWVANGSKEILMDFDHQSEVDEIDSDTEAAAWISNLAIDEEKKALVGDFKFTDKGADAVNNRRLRFLSPTWYTDETGRPKHLTSVALTNKPNIPVEPILNKVEGHEEGQRSKVKGQTMESNIHCLTSDLGPLTSPLTSDLNPPTNQTKGPNMDKIKEALGLPPEASEEEVLAAIQACVAKNKECEAAAAEKEAEEFAEANAKKCNKEVLKAQYIANKEVAKALVAGIPDAPAPKADEPQKILNKGMAPQDAENLDLQRNKALGDYRAAHPGCDFSTAWAACRTNNPEMFND